MQNTNKIIKAEGEQFEALKKTIDKSFELREQALKLEEQANKSVQEAVQTIFPDVKGANIDVRYAEFGQYFLHVVEEKVKETPPADTVLTKPAANDSAPKAD